LNLSLDIKEKQGQTPLNLLASHGYKDANLDLLEAEGD